MEIQQLTELQRHIEAVLFVAEQEVTAKELEQVLAKNFGEDINKEVVQQALDALEEQYKSEIYSFYLVNISDGYRLLTKNDYHKTISLYLGIKSKKKLSRAAMETLAIVAYRQPITKGQIESIRGVSSDYGIQKLLEKELIAIVGRSEGVGRSLLYGTSKIFMDHFGLKSLKDLPKLSEVIPQHNQIGEGEEGETEADKKETDKKDDAKSNEGGAENVAETKGAEKEKVQNESESKSEEEAIIDPKNLDSKTIDPKDALLKTEKNGTLKQEGETDSESEEHKGAELDAEGEADREARNGEKGHEETGNGKAENGKPEAEGGEPGAELEGEAEQEINEQEVEQGEVDEDGGETKKTESEGEETNNEMGKEETPEIEIDEGIFEATNEIIAEGVENRPEAIEGAYDEPHPPTSQGDLSDEIE